MQDLHCSIGTLSEVNGLNTSSKRCGAELCETTGHQPHKPKSLSSIYSIR